MWRIAMPTEEPYTALLADLQTGNAHALALICAPGILPEELWLGV